MAWRRGAASLCVAAAILVVGCAEPPNKEMDRAQGAIDAARAAGADQYATAEYSAATAALDSALDAVAAGDYRLALNYALESHEHAQNAARETVETKARMRSDLERAMAELEALLEKGEAQAGGALRPRTPRRPPAALGQTLSRARDVLQEARKAVGAGDYIKATEVLTGVKEDLEQALAPAVPGATPQSSRRRR